MESTFRTPHELVEGLHAGQPRGRRQLHLLLAVVATRRVGKALPTVQYWLAEMLD